jgi:hypothetical protein
MSNNEQPTHEDFYVGNFYKDKNYEVVVNYTISGSDMENFVEKYRFKPDKYIKSIQVIEEPDWSLCCPDQVTAELEPCVHCGTYHDLKPETTNE